MTHRIVLLGILSSKLKENFVNEYHQIQKHATSVPHLNSVTQNLHIDLKARATTCCHTPSYQFSPYEQSCKIFFNLNNYCVFSVLCGISLQSPHLIYCFKPDLVNLQYFEFCSEESKSFQLISKL